MRQDIDIDELMADTWLTVAQLQHGATAPDGGALYKHCCQQVDSVREALERAGFDAESITHITYAQCALLDESVMNRKPALVVDGESDHTARRVDEGMKAWKTAPLQARYFGSLQAGEVLYDRIAEVLRQPSPVPAVLTCYQRVLALGFQGQYSGKHDGQVQRESILNALNERVAPLDSGISLVVRKTGYRRYNLLRSVWFWIMLAAVITTVVWFGGHLWLQDLLRQQLPELR